MVTTRVHSVLSKINFVIRYIFYEIKYYFIGSGAILEDLLLRHKNKCVPFKKNGDIAVVTGGARGIGTNLVKKLLQCEMHVIIGCRNVQTGLRAIETIRQDGVKSGSTTIYPLDLASLPSVNDFAQKVSANCSHLNLLVNNAGIMFVPYKETEEGFESHWCVNYLGSVLLTHLLIPHLQKAQGPARIVNVTSCAHYAANPISFENIHMKGNYIPSAAYAQSKLAQILFTIELDRRLRESNSNIFVIAVHPGIVNTDIFNGTLLKQIFPWVLRYLCKTVDEGATTILYASVSPKITELGGVYISNCAIKSPSVLAQHKNLQRQLFTHSNTVLKIIKYGNIINS